MSHLLSSSNSILGTRIEGIIRIFVESLS